jgi:hypothetical protein
MSRDEFIGVRVTESEKEKLNEYIEETGEFGSVPKMFRTLARHHINNQGEEEKAQIDPEEVADAVEVAISPVIERLEKLDTRLAELEVEGGGSDENSELVQQLISLLPVHNDKNGLPSFSTIRGTAHENLEIAQQKSTAQAFANYLGEDSDKVRRALATAQHYPDVKYTDEGPFRRYYKTKEEM